MRVMEVQFSSLVLTKFSVPALRQRIVQRTALLDRMTAEVDKHFILVSAPAGYGKTTFLIELVQMLTAQGIRAAWLTLDAEDDNPATFGTYLVASLVQAWGFIPELSHLVQRLRTSAAIDLSGIIQVVINTLVMYTDKSILILDDYHLIRSPAIHTAMTFLLEHLPQNLQVVIGSRSDPPFPLARMRVRGGLLEFRSADLCFTHDETEKFLNDLMRLDLSPQSITMLEERTEGWAAGLQLASLSLLGRSDRESMIESFGGAHRYLVEYLMEEVVERQPEEVKTFLLATSVLERMCAPLCDALSGVGSSKSQVVLEYLVKTNLFIVALDDERTWFRYHHLFQDFLQTRLTKSQPESLVRLHRSACLWLSEHHFLREAAWHAFRTKDWEFAAAFVEQHHFSLIIHGEIATLYDWCQAFPEEVKQCHPLLYILESWAFVLSYRKDNRSRVEALLSQAEEATGTLSEVQMASDIREHAAIVRTFLAMAPDPSMDPQEYLAAIHQLPGDHPEGDPGQFSALLTSGYACLAMLDVKRAKTVLETARRTAANGQLFFGVIESTFHLARLAQSRGRLKESAEICRKGQADLASLLEQPHQNLLVSGCLDIALGCVLLEQYDLDMAEQLLLRGIEGIGWGSNPYYLMTGYSALFHLYLSRGLDVQGLKCLDSLDETWPDIAFYTRALRLVSVLRTSPNDSIWLEEARAWCQEFSADVDLQTYLPGMGPLGAAEVYYRSELAWIELQIIRGQVREARPVLDVMLETAQANGLAGRIMDLTLLDGLCAKKEGDLEHARAALERALAAARLEPYLYCFDLGLEMTELLLQVLPISLFCEDIEKIMSLTGTSPAFRGLEGSRMDANVALELGIVESLSEREAEVLQWIAQGASNQEIAEQLVITIGTVKSHVNHILGKLNAQNRTEAVAKARKLGLA